MTDTTQSATETADNAETTGQTTEVAQTALNAGQQEPNTTETKGQEAQAYEPIKWEELAVPEDFDRTDPSFVGFQQLADAAKINKEQAAKFVEMGTKLRADTIAQEMAKVEVIKTEWLTASKADKEFGGDKFDENMATVKIAYDEMATPELKQLMDKTGMGNHPDMIRAFYRMGLLMKEDGHTNSSQGKAGDELPIEQRLYPNMK